MQMVRRGGGGVGGQWEVGKGGGRPKHNNFEAFLQAKCHVLSNGTENGA